MRPTLRLGQRSAAAQLSRPCVAPCTRFFSSNPYDGRSMFELFPRMPRKVDIGDVSIRDGFQHEEKFISTEAKKYYLREMILAGSKHIEVTNLGNPTALPQFADADEMMRYSRSEELKRVCAKRGVNYDDITFTAVSIREYAVDQALEMKQKGYGPDRVLMMVSTDETHHRQNSGLSLDEYWKEAERCIKKCHEEGVTMCGTVSTIWGSPCAGGYPTDMQDAVEFTGRWLELGADTIEHADHDGSASAPEVFDYFCRILERWPDTDVHVCHFHETKRGVGHANILAALQAGVKRFEGSLGGLGGQPTNWMDDRPVRGTGAYYYKDPDPRYVGLVCIEDLLVQIDEMGIEHGHDVDRVLKLGQQFEKTLGRRLRSDAIRNGRTPHKAKARAAEKERQKLAKEI